MKKGDFLWAAILLAFTAFVVVPATHVIFVDFTGAHPYIGGFIKFGLLATMGEMLVVRLSTKAWKKAPGFIWRVLIWGFLGMAITLIFTIFSGGVMSALDKGMLVGKGNQFAFASELKSLIQHPLIGKNLSTDSEAVALYLHLGYIPSPFSVYKQIRKFPQGSAGVFSKGKLTIKSWWKPEEHILKDLITDEQEAEERFEMLLNDSVKMRLASDVSNGTFLSGGIDSSIITAIAQSQCNGTLNTFSIGFKNNEHNEAPFARKISEQLGTKHHEFILEEQDALNLLPELNDIYDEPFADSSAIPSLLVSKMAKQHVNMALTGDGGDELFFGYGAYQWANRLSNPFSRMLKTPAALLLKAGSSRMERASWLFEYDSNNNLRSHIFSQEQHLFSEKEVMNIFMGSVHNHELTDYEKDIVSRRLSPAELQALFDLKYCLPDDLLVKMDRASMHFSLETRAPLLDRRIIKFALNLSPDLKIKNGQSKYLLKKVLFKHIPKKLFQRPKWGFGIPLGQWMRTSMKTYIDDHLHSDKLAAYLPVKVDDIPAVRKWKAGNDLYFNRVWQLVVLSRFLQK